jgi:hypothetical protein
VEERAANWRQQGWTGYDPNAGPYTGERMAAGAAGMAAHSMREHSMRDEPRRDEPRREEPMGAQRMSTQTSQSMEAGAGQGSAAVYNQGQEAGSRERASQQPDRVAASDYERFAPAFRGHYQTNLAQSGFQYEHFEPAYQYGLTLGNYEPYRGLDWMQIETEARHAWEERNPNTWDRIRDAVRYGWERVKMPVR